MDAKKLEELRAKYANAKAFDVHEEKFKKAAASFVKPDGRRSLPFSGVSTFLDAPYQENLENLDIALVGVPFDLGVSNRPGARFGPRAIREMERIGPYNHQLEVAPQAVCRIADIGDAPISRYSLPDSIKEIENFYASIKKADVRPLSAGGDHSITYPILKAIGQDAPVGLVHFDAHCDTAGEYDDSKFHHGGPFRLAVLDGVLDPDRTIQIGIRGSSDVFWEFSYASGMTVITIEQFMEMGAKAVLSKALEVIGDGPTYISIDVDGFDPSYVPGTGTPEVGGLTPREVQHIVRGLMDTNIIGGDVVEVAPQYDPTTNTAQLAAQMMFEILCVMVGTQN